MSSIGADVFDPFDRGTGNGSRKVEDDWLDQESIFDNQWGSTAATTFHPDNTDANGNPIPRRKQRRLERQYKLHNGKGESTRKETIRQSYIVNDAKTFMSVLELPEKQRTRVLEILDDLDISSKNFGGRPYEKIILALCSLVSDEELSRRLDANEDPSFDSRLYLTEEFRDLMDSTKMSNREHRQIREQIREKSKHF